MDEQYSIINQCLQLLKQSDIPTIKKLRVEIQLIQIKRLLLNDAVRRHKIRGNPGEDPFEGLLSQMRKVCGGSVEAEELNELMNRIGGMLTALNESQVSN